MHASPKMRLLFKKMLHYSTCLHIDQPFPMQKIKGYLAVAAAFFIHLTLGTFYTFGNMNTYMTSYLKAHVEPDLTFNQSIWINSFSMLGQGIIMPLGGVLELSIGARLTCLIGCAVFSGSIALTYFSIKKSFLATGATYGFISCLGLGIAYVAALTTGIKWFPKHKGLVNGIVVAGYGLGALVFNQVQTSYLNPLNKAADKYGYFQDSDVLSKVPTAFLLLGGIYFAVELVACIFLFAPPGTETEYMSLIKSDGEETSDSETVIAFRQQLIRDLKPKEVLKKKEFYILYLTFAATAQSVQFINTMYKAFGHTFISSDRFLATVGSISSIFNSLGRVVWGRAQDMTSYKTCMLALCTVLSSLMFTFYATTRGGEAMYTIWVIAVFFTFSGIFVLLPTATAQAFGPKYAGTNYGMLFTAPALSSLLGAYLVEVVQSSLGYFGSFCLVGGFGVLAFILTFFLPFNLEEVSRKKS